MDIENIEKRNQVFLPLIRGAITILECSDLKEVSKDDLHDFFYGLIEISEVVEHDFVTLVNSLGGKMKSNPVGVLVETLK